MQHKVVYLLLCEFTLHVSGVNHTHHQELPPSNVAKLAVPRWREVAAQKYDQYRRL